MKSTLLSIFSMAFSAVCVAFETPAVLKAVAPGAAFLSGEPVEFTVCGKIPAGSRWTLLDWQGRKLEEGALSDTKFSLGLRPNGYYRLVLDGGVGERSFAVVPEPVPHPRQFFALDSAQSWLSRPDAKNPREPANSYEMISEIARRSGTPMVRERMNWPEISHERGKFAWQQYQTNADLLSRRGVQVLGMYHSAPAWAVEPGSGLPMNLAAAYEMAKTAAEHFRGKMTAWEFWNEEDDGFGANNAWDYAAALKASALGFKAADPMLPVCNGGLANVPLRPFAETMMMNGICEYIDIFAVHTYGNLNRCAGTVQSIRNFLARHGAVGKPIWFTENGCMMEGPGKAPSYIPGLKAHSTQQEFVVAEFLAKNLLSMQSLGVARDFFFVLSPYNEGDGEKDWGLVRRDYTVKPGFAAFATLGAQLGDAVLEGEVHLGKGLKGMLYRRAGGSKTLVYWAISPLETGAAASDSLLERTFALPCLGNRPIQGIGPFGTPFEAVKNAIPATRYPAYLTHVEGLTAEAPTNPPAASPPTIPSAVDLSIIFRAKLSENCVTTGGRNAIMVTQDSAHLVLQIWNLSGQPKTGSLAIAGGKAEGIPQSVIVPPFGKIEIPLAFTPAFDEQFRSVFRVDGQFGGHPVTQLAIPVQPNLEKLRQESRFVPVPRMMDPNAWSKNSSGALTIAATPDAQAIAFTTRFPEKVDRWTYPEFTLQLPQESLAGAVGVSFEACVSSPVKFMLLMAVKKDGDALFLSCPAHGGISSLSGAVPTRVDPASIVKLRVGVNTAASEVTVRARKFQFFYRH